MKSRQVGLVVTGEFGKCSLARLRNLPEWLGPVKAKTFRQASRFVNSKRAGFPIHSYSELESARTIVVSGPTGKLSETIQDIAGAGLSMGRKTVLLSSGDVGSTALEELEQRGAQTAALTLFDDAPKLWFLVEGRPAAVRKARRLVEGGDGVVTEVERGCLALCGAAMSFAGWLLLPTIDASAQSLRKAGLSPRHAAPLVERMVERTLRAYLKGGRRAWKPPDTAERQDAFIRQLEEMRQANSELAGLLECLAQNCLERANRSTEWCSSTKALGAAAGR